MQRKGTDNQLKSIGKSISDTRLALLQLHERGEFSVSQLISSDDGTVAGVKSVPGHGTLS
eukprot:2757432-Rhodomonas_salina.2